MSYADKDKNVYLGELADNGINVWIGAVTVGFQLLCNVIVLRLAGTIEKCKYDLEVEFPDGAIAVVPNTIPALLLDLHNMQVGCFVPSLECLI